MIGMKIKNYTIKSRIGGGGMANVFLADEIRDGRVIREVAVKILHPALGNDDDYIARFESEARGAAGLNHPNIVTIHDFGSDNGVYYIVMEYVRGGDLRDVLKRQPWLPQELVLLLVEEIAVGLQVLHEKNLVHRDLKPANILLSQDGHLKLGDLGLAKTFGGSVTHGLTAPGLILGTAYYMSPEQCVGGGVDNRSDIFSLGVTAYEMISGSRPFSGETYSQIVESLTTHTPPAVGTLVGCVSTELEQIVDRMLAKEPARRPQTVDEILEALRVCAMSLPDPTGHLMNRRAYIRTLTTDAPGLATRIWGESVKRFVQRGEYYRALGRERFHDAIGEFERALQIDATNAAAKRGRDELLEATQTDAPPPRRPSGGGPAASTSGAEPAAPGPSATAAAKAPESGQAPPTAAPPPSRTARAGASADPNAAATVIRAATTAPAAASAPRRAAAGRAKPGGRAIAAMAGLVVVAVVALVMFVGRDRNPSAVPPVIAGRDSAKAATPRESAPAPGVSDPGATPPGATSPGATSPGTTPTSGVSVDSPPTSTAPAPKPVTPPPAPPTRTPAVETPPAEPAPATGELRLESVPPGARVTTLDAPAGASNRRVATRRALALTPGRWSFRFELAGYLPRDSSIVVVAGEQRALTLRLQPKPEAPRAPASSDAYVSVSISQPATLYVDDQLYDRRLGRSYLVRLVPNRPYKLQVKVPGGAGRTWTAISVAVGDTLILRHAE